DMDDYRALLLGKRKGGNGESRERAGAETGNARPETDSAQPAAPRREQRRRAAEKRQALAPLRERLRRAEAGIARLTSKKANIAKALADPALYEGDTAQLIELQRQHGEIERDIEEAETAWLTLQEELE